MAVIGDRSQHFPAIERKHGQPMSFWFDQLREFGDTKYEHQIAFLRENHGFSQAHANAVVMYHRGSTTTRRHSGPEAWFAELDATKEKTARAIFKAITSRFTDLDLVIAWNQPMLRSGKGYVFGLSVSKNHFTLNPMSSTVLDAMSPDLAGYRVNKKTFVVPTDWKVDASLLRKLVEARLAEIEAS